MEIENITAKKAYLDTNIFIYLLENITYSNIIERLIKKLNRINCKIYTSDITLAECLVKPFTDNDIISQNSYTQSIKNNEFLTVKKVSRGVLIEAARLRSCVGNKLPDSIHLATALLSGCDVFIGNDKKLKTSDDIEKIIISDLF